MWQSVLDSHRTNNLGGCPGLCRQCISSSGMACISTDVWQLAGQGRYLQLVLDSHYANRPVG